MPNRGPLLMRLESAMLVDPAEAAKASGKCSGLSILRTGRVPIDGLTERPGAEQDRAMRLAAAFLLLATSAAAQTPGAASFRDYEKGKQVGTVDTTVERTAEGWRVRGTSRITGSVVVTIPNFDLYYDRTWRGRFMTVEMKSPDDAIMHVAVVGTTTRTDIVRATEVRFRSSSVSPDTIFLPDRTYGAYEAVAARLPGMFEGEDLPLFIAPLGETRVRIDAVRTEPIRTARGPLMATRYHLTEIRERPTPVELWVDRGRLLRVDQPRAAISVVRVDVLP
jgi:hypothetical protein